MPTFGSRSKFALVIGGGKEKSKLRDVDIYAAGRWLTCDDCAAFLPPFIMDLRGEVQFLIDGVDERLRRPFPELPFAENHARLLAERDELQTQHHRFRFMNWGPTTDNVSATLFVEGEIAVIAFSFWREMHHDPSELGQTFVAELPLRELTSILYKAMWELCDGMGKF